jgi:biotin carboxyl carrier protein
MPGVVVSLLVTEGDVVEEGQPLLVLEAMKMQNEIAAPAAGSVRLIHVQEGEAVSAGAKLVELEVAPES